MKFNKLLLYVQIYLLLHIDDLSVLSKDQTGSSTPTSESSEGSKKNGEDKSIKRVDLYVNINDSIYYVDFEQKEKLKIYTGKNGFEFKSLIKKSNCSEGEGSIIWKASSDTESCKKVEYEEGAKKITLHLNDGKTKTLIGTTKDGCDCKCSWACLFTFGISTCACKDVYWEEEGVTRGDDKANNEKSSGTAADNSSSASN